MEDSVNLNELLGTLKKRLSLIIIVTIITVIISAIFTFFVMTPQYEASTQILVNQSQDGEQPITANELQSNREFINTYSVIISSPTILEQVISETGIDRNVEELQDQITVAAENESQVANLSVQDADPQTAVSLANAIGDVFEREVPAIMAVDNVSILSEAQIGSSDSPISPQPLANLAIGLFVGLMLGIALAFIIEFLDKSIKTESDVEKELGIPVLGTIPVMLESDLASSNSNKRSKDFYSDDSHKNSRRKTS